MILSPVFLRDPGQFLFEVPSAGLAEPGTEHQAALDPEPPRLPERIRHQGRRYDHHDHVRHFGQVSQGFVDPEPHDFAAFGIYGKIRPS